jgi:hypothetical protein
MRVLEALMVTDINFRQDFNFFGNLPYRASKPEVRVWFVSSRPYPISVLGKLLP